MSGLLATAAVVMTLVVVRRELVPQRAPVPASDLPRFVADWKDITARVGRSLGPANAPIQLVEFTDLECPFCKRYNATIDTVLKRFPTEVNFVYVHFPLTSHRFARPAARAVECAGKGGLFRAMVDVVFAKQDSLGLKSWDSYAAEAGVRDTAGFAICNADTTRIAAIDEGFATARRIAVKGTPALMLNGWLLNAPPRDEELVRAIGELLQGRQPYKTSNE